MAKATSPFFIALDGPPLLSLVCFRFAGGVAELVNLTSR